MKQKHQLQLRLLRTFNDTQVPYTPTNAEHYANVVRHPLPQRKIFLTSELSTYDLVYKFSRHTER